MLIKSLVIQVRKKNKRAKPKKDDKKKIKQKPIITMNMIIWSKGGLTTEFKLHVTMIL